MIVPDPSLNLIKQAIKAKVALLLSSYKLSQVLRELENFLKKLTEGDSFVFLIQNSEQKSMLEIYLGLTPVIISCRENITIAITDDVFIDYVKVALKEEVDSIKAALKEEVDNIQILIDTEPLFNKKILQSADTYLFFNQSLFDGEVLKKSANRYDLILQPRETFQRISGKPQRILKNGIKILENLYTLVDKYNYKIVIYTDKDYSEAIKFLKNFKEYCNLQGKNRSLPISVMVSYMEATLEEDIGMDVLVMKNDLVEKTDNNLDPISLIYFDKANKKSLASLRKILENEDLLNLTTRESRQKHIIFDNNDEYLRQAELDGYQTHLIVEADLNSSLDAKINAVMSRFSSGNKQQEEAVLLSFSQSCRSSFFSENPTRVYYRDLTEAEQQFILKSLLLPEPNVFFEKITNKGITVETYFNSLSDEEYTLLRTQFEAITFKEQEDDLMSRIYERR